MIWLGRSQRKYSGGSKKGIKDFGFRECLKGLNIYTFLFKQNKSTSAISRVCLKNIKKQSIQNNTWNIRLCVPGTPEQPPTTILCRKQ